MTITYGDIRANITTRHRETKNSSLEIGLQPNTVVSLQPTRGQTKILCETGMLWITQQGDPMDYFLKAGEIFEPYQAGLLVVQAMGESSARIAE